MGHIQNDVHNTEMCVILPWIGEGSSRWAARRTNYGADRKPLRFGSIDATEAGPSRPPATSTQHARADWGA